MINRLLNRLSLIRLYQVLVLSLLLPTTVWANYTYGGETLTFNYTGDSGPNYYYSGSDNKEWNVTADAFYQSSSYLYSGFNYVKLTYVKPLKGSLLGFTLAGNINNIENYVNLKVYRLTSLNATEGTLIGSIAISGTDVPSYTYTAEDGVSQSFNNEYIQLALERSSSDTNPTFQTTQITNITLTFSGTDYGLSIGDYRVTSNNANNVLGDANSSVSYNATDKILALNNATIGSIISNLGNEQLTINIAGTNKLNGFLSDESSSGTLKFTGSGSLEISNSGGTISGYTAVDFGGFYLASKSDPGIYWDEEHKKLCGFEGTASNVTITTEEYYPIWIYDSSISSTGYSHTQLKDEKLSVGVGSGTVTFDKEHTITISNAQFNYSSNNLIVVGPSMSQLTVDLVGESTGGEATTILNLWDTTPLTFTTDESNPGSLTAPTIVNWNDFGNGQVTYQNGLVFNIDSSPYNETISTTGIRIKIGDTTINTTGNITVNNGTAYYNASNNTLTLTGATIGSETVSKDIQVFVDGLNLVISGTCKINGNIVYSGPNLQTSLIQISNADAASLTVSGISGFGNCSWSDGLYLSAANSAGIPTDIHYEHFENKGGSMMSDYGRFSTITFSTTKPSESIWIGTTQVGANGNFSGIEGVSFDSYNNILSFNNANLGGKGHIITSLPNLTINLTGENGEHYGRSDLDGNKYIISTDSQATLTFTTDGNCSLCSTIDNYEIPWKGFKGNPTFKDKLVFLQAAGTMSIEVLQAPTMSYSSGNLSFGGLSDGYGNDFDCYYSITYEDGNGNINYTKYEPGNGGQPNPVSMEGRPCTVKAYVTYEDRIGNTTQSEEATGYYLKFAEDMKVTFNGTEREIQKADYPALIPNVDDIEFILSNSTNTNAICQEMISDESHIMIKGFGATDLILYNSNPGFTVLNSDGGAVNLKAKVIPSAPTFSIEAGTYDEAKTLTLTSPYQKTNADDQTIIEIKYSTSESPNTSSTYSEPIVISHSKTISAWVEASITSQTGIQETYASDTISQAYVIKEEASIDFMQEENGDLSTIEAGQVITGTYGSTNPKVVMPYASDLHGTINFTSSNEAVVASNSISLNEEYALQYTVLGTGQTTIQASYTPTQDELILPTTSNFELKIEPRDITNATISMGTSGETAFVYKGSAIEPITSVSFAASEGAVAATLNAGTDFELNYYIVSGETETALDGAPTNVGSYKVTVNAKGNYTGSKSAPFTITPATITPTVEITGWAYGATANTPTVSGNTGSGNVTYEYKLKNAEDSEYKTDVPTEAGEYTVKATIAATANYEAATATADFTISKASITPTVTLEGWTYGTTAKTPSVSGNTESGNVTYEYKLKNAEDSEYKTDVPTEAGEYTVKATIAATANYEAATATADFTISKATPSIIFDEENYSATYGEAFTAPTPTTSPEGLTVVVTSSSNTQVATIANGVISIIGVGETTITVSFAGNDNYNATTATYKLTVGAASMEIVGTGYSGIYDGQAHGITVNAPQDAVIKYGTTEGTYNLETSPEYTDAGNYTVYYQVTRTNYQTVTGSKTVVIAKADVSITYNEDGYTTTYGEEFNPPTPTTNPTGLTLTPTSSSNTQVATVTDGRINITGVGETNITVSFAGNNNYNDTTVTYKLTVGAASMEIVGTGYSGIYDGQAHGIIVTAPEEATIKYGTTEGTYNLNASPEYTDAGSYTVYYQVTQENYQTVTGSKTIVIAKADVSITYNEDGYTATYGEEFNPPTPSTNPEELPLTATSSSDTQVATVTDGRINITGVGETNITVSFSGNNNYNDTTVTYKLTVEAASMSVTAEGFSGVYDSEAHGITITAPEVATIKYGTTEGTYNLDASPEYTDAGNYTVYYQVTQENYQTVTGSKTVIISKADINPTIALEGWTYGATANTPEVNGNTGNGTETITYKAEGAEEFSSEVPSEVGTYIVKVTIAETTNYNGGEATSTFTITNRTIDPAEDIEFSEGQSYASFYSANEDLALPEEGIAVFMITGLDGNTLTTQAVTYIPKGVPVLVMKASGTTQAIDPSEVSNNMLHYATSDVTADGTTYILYNGEYVRATGTIPAGKCYLKLNKPSGARALAIGNGTTGIDRLDNTIWATDNWFDLNGRRIEKPTKKGLYIKNGKKVVVK